MSSHRDLGGFLLLAAVWGSSFVATEVGLTAMSPVVLAAFRFDLAGVLMLAYARRATAHWRPRTRAEWRIVAVGGVLIVALHHALLFAGQQYVTAAVAAVVISSIPVLVTGLSRALLPTERLRPRGLVGLLLGLAGVAIIARPSPGALLSPDLRGIGLVFGSALAWALAAVLVERDRTALPPASMQAWMMVVGAPLLHAAVVVLPGESLAGVDPTVDAVLALLYLGPVAGGLGYLLYFALLDRLGPIEINLVSYAVPVFAAVVGWLVLAEPVSAATAAGFLVILAGFVLVKYDALVAEVRHLYEVF